MIFKTKLTINDLLDLNLKFNELKTIASSAQAQFDVAFHRKTSAESQLNECHRQWKNLAEQMIQEGKEFFEINDIKYQIIIKFDAKDSNIKQIEVVKL